MNFPAAQTPRLICVTQPDPDVRLQHRPETPLPRPPGRFRQSLVRFPPPDPSRSRQDHLRAVDALLPPERCLRNRVHVQRSQAVECLLLGPARPRNRPLGVFPSRAPHSKPGSALQRVPPYSQKQTRKSRSPYGAASTRHRFSSQSVPPSNLCAVPPLNSRKEKIPWTQRKVKVEAFRS